MRIRFSLGILAVFFSLFSIHAQLIRTVHVNSPGTLSSLLGSDKNLVTGLTLTGTINDVDFQTIKEMNLLKDLDMSAMNIENGKIPDGAFYGKIMDRIVVPVSVKIIGGMVFCNTVIPNLDLTNCVNLEELGFRAFDNIDLINNVLDFSNCRNLNRIAPNTHESPFWYCSAHVILPKNMTILPANTFNNFKGSVDLPPNLETIEAAAFASAELSTEIILPSSLRTIGGMAFYKMVVTKLDFSNCINLEELGFRAFDSIELTNNILDFSNCRNLNRISPNTNEGPFWYCSAHVILPRNMTILPANTFNNFKGSVDLPPNLETIEAAAFASAELSTEVILPSSLRTIGGMAFYKMVVTKLDFSNCISLEELGFRAFDNINLTNNILDFSNCRNLNRISTYSSEGAFWECSAHVILPQNMKILPALTFSSFKGSVDLPPILETIGSNAFANAKPCAEIILPPTLKTIEEGAFQNFTTNNLTLPSSLVTIGGMAFHRFAAPELDFTNCISLEEVGFRAFDNINLSDNMLDFSNCQKLNRISTYFSEGAFWECSTYVILPRNMKILPALTFCHFKGTVDLSPVLEKIESNAFYNSTIKEITFSSTLQYIDHNAFDGCTQLNTIICLAPIPPSLGNTVFYNVNKQTCKLYVPKGTVPLYQAADQWKDFFIEEYSLSLTDNLTLIKQTDPNLYKVKTGEEFNISLNASIITGIRIGLFYNQLFIEDIDKSTNNDGIFTCSISTDVLSGSYIIQPYIIEEGEKVIISRKQGTHIIDRLPIAVVNNWDAQTRSVARSADTEINNHLLINTGQTDLLEIASGKNFNVLLRYTNHSPDIRIGLFNPENGSLIESINQSVNGNIFTCKIPASVPVGKYTLIPYQVVNGNNVYIERQDAKPYLVDRLPLNIVEGSTEPTGSCLIIEARDNISNTSLSGGKYKIEGNGIDESYIVKVGEENISIKNMLPGEYTITEIYPPAKYKISANKQQTININNVNCQTVTFENIILSNQVDLVFKLNGDTAHYTGVRVGEYYWMNKNMHKPLAWNPVTTDQINNSHQWYRMFQYRGDPLYTNQVSMNDFNYYYGQYYSRPEFENIVVNGQTDEYVNGNKINITTNWGDPWLTGGLQLIGMCGNVSEKEVRQYLSYGHNPNSNNVPVVLQPKDYFPWFYHSFGNTVNYLDKDYETNGFDPVNTNKYGFNLLPNGSRFNGSGILHLNHGGNDSEDIPVVLGDFNALNQKAAFNLSMSGLDIAEAPMVHYTKVYHLATERLARRISDEELGYRLYINRENFRSVDPEVSLINSEEYLVKCVWKTKQLHPELDVMDIIRDYLKLDIIKLGLEETPPAGYSELPNGFIRGLYVQYFIESPNGGRTVKSVDDIIYIAQFNPLLWRPDDIGEDLVTRVRDAAPDITNLISLDQNNQIFIYPNPVSDILYIKSDNIQLVEIYDLTGRLLIKEALSSINVNNLKPGMYIVKVTTVDGVTTHKVSKK